MSDLEFNIQISGSNNDSNLVLKSESAVINDVEGGASSVSSEKVSALEKKLKILDNLEEIKFDFDIPSIPQYVLPKNDEQVLWIFVRQTKPGFKYTEANKKANESAVIMSSKEYRDYGEVFQFYSSDNTKSVSFAIYNSYKKWFEYAYANSVEDSIVLFPQIIKSIPGAESIPQSSLEPISQIAFVANDLNILEKNINDPSLMPKWEDISPANKSGLTNTHGLTKETYEENNFTYVSLNKFKETKTGTGTVRKYYGLTN